MNSREWAAGGFFGVVWESLFFDCGYSVIVYIFCNKPASKPPSRIPHQLMITLGFSSVDGRGE